MTAGEDWTRLAEFYCSAECFVGGLNDIIEGGWTARPNGLSCPQCHTALAPAEREPVDGTETATLDEVG
jgi:hypothetical protein